MTPTPSFKIEVREGASGACILKLIGALTIQTLFDFQAAVRAVSSQALILDFSGVPYMDSAGLGSVINACTACERTRRAFAVTGMSDRIRTLFAVTHADGILPCFDSLEAAEASGQASGK